MYENFQQDSQLIDTILIIEAGLLRDEKLIKQAGVVDFLGGTAETIKNIVQRRVSEEGIVGAIITYFGTGYIWKKLPLAGIILSIADWLGISLGKVFNYVKDSVISVFKSKGKLTEGDARQIAEQSVSSISATASMDFLHKLHKEGKISTMLNKDNKETIKIASGFFGKIISNAFGILGKGKSALKLFAGFLKYFIMAILGGFAALESGSVISGVVSGDKAEFDPNDPQSNSKLHQAKINFNTPSHNLKPSGKGEQYFINSGENQWWIMLQGRDIKRTMLNWAKAIYPELVGHDAEIINSKSFDRTAYILNKNYDPSYSGKWLMVPQSNLNKWRDIVDTFAGEAASKIQQKGA